MYNFKRSLIAFVGLIALVGVVAAITPFKGYGQQSPEAVAAVQDVRVVNPSTNPALAKIVNTPNDPVFVTGTVNVSNGTVNLGNLTSNPANVRSVETIGQSVYRATATFINSGTIGTNDPGGVYQVPAGKRLVIEHVSAQAALPSGQNLTEFSLVILNSARTTTLMVHYLPVPEGKSNGLGGDVFSSSLPLRIYVDAGMKVGIIGSRDSSTGSGRLDLSFSGYLVNPT